MCVYLSNTNEIKIEIMKTTENKIKLSFELEFNQTAESITFNNTNGFVKIGNKEYYCVLNSKGVRKNSWRLEC